MVAITKVGSVLLRVCVTKQRFNQPLPIPFPFLSSKNPAADDVF
jgi:hypothetical protein